MTVAKQASRTSANKDGHTVTVHIPVTFRQRAGRKQILSTHFNHDELGLSRKILSAAAYASLLRATRT
jgi:hypothetical protein